MGVSIIIVNYNTKDLLVSCIESIRKYCLRTPYEIIVVDNASTDDSVNELLKVDPKDRKSTRLNSSHIQKSRMPSSA